MKNILPTDTSLQPMVTDAISSLDAAGLNEILCAIILPLLALLIGIRVNRWIDERPRDTLHAHVVDFIAPLLAPVLAILFTALARFVFHVYDIPTFVLPFVVKLSIAWLAMHIVVRMSSRQSAGWLIALVIIPITLLHLFNLWDPVTEALSSVKMTFGNVKVNAYGILKSIAALIALFWVAGFIVGATDSRLRRMRGVHVSNRVLIMKFFQIVLYFVVFLIGMQIMGISLTALSVFGGALGVGIGFGLQKIASNFISGIILLFEKSVQVDDLIELSDGTTGFIRQTAARYTLLEAADGREILIPNEEFISQRVTTLTHTNRRGRVEITVGVGYDSDITQVRELMLAAARACSRCTRDPAPVCFLTGFADSSLTMLMYFWVDNVADGRLEPRHEVLSAILTAFRANNISIPYPHQVQLADPVIEARIATLEDKLAPATKQAKKP